VNAAKALQQTGLSVASLPLAPAAERRYVGQTVELLRNLSRAFGPARPVFTKKCISQTLKDLRLESVATGRPHLLRGVSMEACKFDSVALAKPFHGWHEFEDVHALDCCFRNCLVNQARLTRVTLRRCQAPDGGIVLWKCILDQVTFDGEYESLRILPSGDHRYDASVSGAFAVDVRTAKCTEIELLGIPPPLVRFDPCSAAVLSRDMFSNEQDGLLARSVRISAAS
jgi:hypothetical protein